jgi:hypothetical protein
MEHIIEPPPKYAKFDLNIGNIPIRQEFTRFEQNFIINKGLVLLKPICFYFYKDSLDTPDNFGTVKLVYDEDTDIIIYKDDNQHSSNVISLSVLKDIYLCETENTIYIVSSNIDISEL